MAVLLLASGVSINIACDRGNNERYAQDIEKIAAAPPRWVSRDALGKRLWGIERKFYEERDWAPAWVDGRRPSPRLDELLQVLRDSELHGLSPASYDYDDLATARAKADEKWLSAAFEDAQIPDMDLRLTYAFLSHAVDLIGWRHTPKDIDANWIASPKKVDLAKQLREAVDANTARTTLESLAPQHSQYKGLQAALEKARKEGGSSGDRIEKIRMNLERWRWAPHDLGERHILINVPSYQMQVIEHDKPVLAMRVIVGAADTPTPLFSDSMTYVVFSPYWNIPEKILREETIPRIAEDPDYLSRNNIEVVGTSGDVVDPKDVDWGDTSQTDPLHFRQMPGPDNALGLVKFIFPNHFNVYLHDTPGDALFKCALQQGKAHAQSWLHSCGEAGGACRVRAAGQTTVDCGANPGGDDEQGRASRHAQGTDSGAHRLLDRVGRYRRLREIRRRSVRNGSQADDTRPFERKGNRASLAVALAEAEPSRIIRSATPASGRPVWRDAQERSPRTSQPRSRRLRQVPASPGRSATDHRAAIVRSDSARWPRAVRG
jgi:hypothetical protein